MFRHQGNWIAVSLLGMSLCLGACSKSSNDDAMIREAIQTRLKGNTNLNMAAFDTDIQQVKVNGDQAEAQVNFKIKGGPGAMQLTYRLQKQESNWVVLDSNGDPGSGVHAGADAAPGMAAPLTPPGASHSLSDTLRGFKDGTPDAAPQLPPGHPQINGSPTTRQ